MSRHRLSREERRQRRQEQRQRSRRSARREALRRNMEHTVSMAKRWRFEHPDAEPTEDEPEWAWVDGRLRERASCSEAELEFAIGIRDARDAARWYSDVLP